MALANYILTNLKALGFIVVALTGGAIPFIYGVIALSLVMVIYETLGGMRSVAWTDALQGIILIVGIITIFISINVEYGGLDFIYDQLNRHHLIPIGFSISGNMLLKGLGQQQNGVPISTQPLEEVEGKFDVVMAYDVSRVSRNLSQLITFLNTMSDTNVSVYLHQQQVSTDTPAGRMLVEVCGAMASFELALQKERIKAGLATESLENYDSIKKRIVDILICRVPGSWLSF